VEETECASWSLMVYKSEYIEDQNSGCVMMAAFSVLGSGSVREAGVG
jgi:hypothetical protein